MNNNVFLNKVKDVIKEVGFEENVSYTSLMLEMSGETITELQRMKSEISDLCSFLNGEKAFDETHIGVIVFKLSDFLDYLIDFNKENKTRMELLLCVKSGVIFIKDLMQACIDEELWDKLTVISAETQSTFSDERRDIEAKSKLFGEEGSRNKELKYTRLDSIHCISTHRARYVLEKENKKVSSSRLSVYSKRIAKNMKKLVRKEDKISIVIMSCPVTNKELGFYIESIAHEISILGLAYVHPEFRGLGLFNKLVIHFEENSKEISCLEVDPDEVDFSKSLYKKWGYTKSVGGFLPNNYLLIKEDNLSDFFALADTLKKAA